MLLGLSCFAVAFAFKLTCMFHSTLLKNDKNFNLTRIMPVIQLNKVERISVSSNFFSIMVVANCKAINYIVVSGSFCFSYGETEN